MATALSACHHHDDPKEETPADRTVLVYIAGENNLSSYADNDIQEMKTGSLQLNDRQNLVVYVDKASSSQPFLARVKNGELVDTLFMEESITADPAVLENVIRQTRQDYPAQNYGLVIWGHASGWLISADSIAYQRSRAIAGDTGNNSSSGAGRYWMNIPPLARAIRNAMGDEQLKFVFGDCCSFSCLEVAYELKDVAEYVIGSPAEIPDAGAPYDLIVPDMFIQTDEFHRSLIDHYFDYYIDYYKDHGSTYYNLTQGDLANYSVPLTAIKTSALENLAYATSTILNTIADKFSQTGSLDINNAVYYAYANSNRYNYDIYSILKKNASESDFAAWESTFTPAIAYHRFSGKWMTVFSSLMYDMERFDAQPDENGCLAMFFPRTNYRSTSPNWNTAIRQFKLNDVIRWEQYGW